MGNGEPFKLGGKQIKNVVGYDLIRLLVGSEGTLGIIIEITLKLIPKPKVIHEALCGFGDPLAAAKVLIEVRQSGVQPSTAEFMLDVYVWMHRWIIYKWMHNLINHQPISFGKWMDLVIMMHWRKWQRFVIFQKSMDQ